MPSSDKRVIEVSAVVFFDADGRMLTVRKRGTELFMHPGGKPEPGESAVDAAVREVAEELGVRVQPAELTFLGTFISDAANESDALVKAHLFEYRPGDPAENAAVLISQPAAEIAELRWLNFSAGAELPDDLAPLVTEHVLQLYGFED
ncbi:NUDIX domain-containing protein [uncultured Corynebacterium sp.]|uniref:NUDIX hydrolase n=1 Tax=uncultured Corynebacterium sp. TaxID=159447 RepID=UPI00259198B4|nr:NUDIX domain-containing protein [uncultured Corynebacterium sp.]